MSWSNKEPRIDYQERSYTKGRAHQFLRLSFLLSYSNAFSIIFLKCNIFGVHNNYEDGTIIPKFLTHLFLINHEQVE